MKIAPYIAALAIGLAFASAQALAADQPDRHGRGKDNAAEHHQTNDQGVDRQRTRTQHDNKNYNNNRDNRRIRTDRWRQNVDQNRLRRRDQANDRWRHDNQRHIELRRWQRSHHARHRFHVGPYRGPRGYYYHRWNYGQYLPPIYFVRSYWLIDFLIYGLLAPPPGCIWVRYGPDALLIDLETGEIVQVVYGVFY